MLTDLAASAELFHTADGTAFADLMIDGHRETWPVRSIRMRSWLRRKYYEATGAAAARERSIRHSICLRHGRSLTPPGGPFTCASRSMMVASIWILLTSSGVLLRSDPMDGKSSACPPVRFRRAAGMLPLPMPIRGGSLEALTSFFNLANRSDFVLVVAWLLAALRHGGPYPLLAVSGEQGSAKTVFSKILRGLIDPNAAPVRTGHAKNAISSSRPAMVICLPSTICRTYRLGCPIRYADSQAVVALRFVSSTPTEMKCSFRLPVRSS